MNIPMVILENEYKIPNDIIRWADSHSVPILKGTLKNCHDDISYIIEYSDECDIAMLDLTYCHAYGLAGTIGNTPRLIIRELSDKDMYLYRRLIKSYPDVLNDISMAGLSPKDFKLRHEAYIRYSYGFLGYGIWGIFLKQGGMIGIAGIDGTDEPELSYALFKKYFGKGYAFEACDFILKYCRSVLNLNNIIINTDFSNTRSIKLAEKLKEIHPSLEIRIKNKDISRHPNVFVRRP
ncbi:MAG: GNAT family N-acetyltransferase [Lachnospiraceae bacterium]|nr:GNAT family N-acetyltransferase [Lachnospiraceae bacterium]